MDPLNVQFTDFDSMGEALVIVKEAMGQVGLTTSLLSNGDIEVYMPPAVAKQVAEALTLWTKSELCARSACRY